MPLTQPPSERFILGGAVKRIREARGIRQIDMAVALGYADATYLAKIEKGLIGRPSLDLIRRIADQLAVGVSDISYVAPVLCDHIAAEDVA